MGATVKGGDRTLLECEEGWLVGAWLIEAPAVLAGEVTDLFSVAVDGEWSPSCGMMRLVLPEECREST